MLGLSPNPSTLCLGFLERTNFIVITFTGIFMLYTRSAGVAYFSAGAVGCSFSVKLVKRIIRHPRPPNTPGRRGKVSYGMPSTHSAALAYFATYILLACIYLPMHPSLRPGFIFRVFPPLLTLPWASMAMMSRIWLGHHTWRQVAAGVIYGAGWANICFKLWTMGLNDLCKESEQTFKHRYFTLWQ